MLAPPVRVPPTRMPPPLMPHTPAPHTSAPHTHSLASQCVSGRQQGRSGRETEAPHTYDPHTSASPPQFGLTVRQREAAGEEWARDRGTPRYMAPEFWDDELADAIGEAADVRRGGCPGKRGVGGLRVELADAIGEGGEDAWRQEGPTQGSPWVGSRPCGKVCPCEWDRLPSCLVVNVPVICPLLLRCTLWVVSCGRWRTRAPASWPTAVKPR